MIRYKDRILEDYFIDPETAVITDKNGVVQKTYLNQGRLKFKKMSVHCIMAHTYLGYKPGYDVHHLDGNKMNNSLRNLVYLSHSEHTKLHHFGKISGFCGKHHSEDAKIKIGKASSERYKQGLPEYVKAKISIAQTGMKQFNNGIKNTWAKEKPSPEWAEGWIKKRRTA